MPENVGAMERAQAAYDAAKEDPIKSRRDWLRAAVLAFLDLSQAETEAVTAAAREARDRHPPKELWFDIDETEARLSGLRALAQENPNA